MNDETVKEELNLTKTVLRNLVSKLEHVHADPEFIGVWTINQLHNGKYTGPTYVDELKEAKALLSQ